MKQASQRDLEILKAVASYGDVTQRGLSRRLGIALGLTNLYVKRLLRKGHIKITTIPPNRVKYLLTPRGLAEKSRLTSEYIRYSLQLYRRARQALRAVIEPRVQDGQKRFALYGTGEAAEFAYLTLHEFDIQPVAVYSDAGESRFLDLPVRPVAELKGDEIDCIIVATFEAPSAHVAELLQRGIVRDKILLLLDA